MCWSSRLLATLSVFCTMAAGCFPRPDLAVQEVRYPAFEQFPAIEGCDDHEVVNNVEILEIDEPLSDGCRPFGDLFIGDSGTTYTCELEVLIHRLRHAACEAGTMKAQIIHITPPHGGSSCHQLRAALIVCE